MIDRRTELLFQRDLLALVALGTVTDLEQQDLWNKRERFIVRRDVSAAAVATFENPDAMRASRAIQSALEAARWKVSDA